MLFELGSYILDIDVDRTRAFYKQAPKITESCDCQGCRNYVQWAETLSAEPKYTLERMGILLEKSPEVYVNCPNQDGTLFYGGFYHLCGKIIQGKDAWYKIEQDTKSLDESTLVSLTQQFQIAFSEYVALLEKDFPSPVIQMEISANLPFVLPEKCAY